MKYEGVIDKMLAHDGAPVRYELPVADETVDMSALVGERIALRFTGNIVCVACGRSVRKTFNQGYCFPCFKSLAACDRCITSPELCHFEAGTCRDPAWGERHCMQPHVVYLANSSGVKVGITRASQIPTRWLDQGAIQALPVIRVATRFHSGLVEVMLKNAFRDRTDWRAMLKNVVESVDLAMVWREHCQVAGIRADSVALLSSAGSAELIENAHAVAFEYPVIRYPKTVRAIDIEKTRDIEEVLVGIKGQYLIFESGVLNVRKYRGYEMVLES